MKNLIYNIRQIKSFIEIYRYVIVGFGTVGIDITVYFCLSTLGIFGYETSKRISFISGSIFRFIMDRNYVFKATNKLFLQIISFPILYLITFTVNTITHDYILHRTQIPTISLLIATSFSTTINFLGQKFIVFRR